jgi:tryptophan-rich sensory protein
MLFGNRTLGIHLARGLLGFVCLYVALAYGRQIGWPAVLLLPSALWAMKGCPTCWMVGLGETLARRRHSSVEPS